MTQISAAGLSFGERKDEYKKFRLSYPPWLFGEIFAAVPPHLAGVAVDLGSGTGLSAIPLTERFHRVIAIEPDARMAGQIPQESGVEVKVARSEDVELPVETVDLVTCGTAFYWMDGPAVLERVRSWLVPNGVLAVFRYALPEAPKPLAAILDREFREHWDAFRHPRLLDEAYSARVISESPFFENKRVIVRPQYYEMNAASFVGFFGSTSYVGAYQRSGNAPADYLDRLRQEVEAEKGKGDFKVNFPTELILAEPAK